MLDNKRVRAQRFVLDFIPWAVGRGLPPRGPRGSPENKERVKIWRRLYSEWCRLRREGKL